MKTPVHAAMPELRLEPGSPVSLQRQVYGALRQIVGWGGLERGTPLPSTRRLGTVLGVSRNTVLFAHEKLAAEGVIYGRTGSGSRVRQANEAVCLPDPDGFCCIAFRRSLPGPKWAEY